MQNQLTHLASIIICMLVVILLACSPIAQHTTIEDGCPKPPPSVFTKVGFDANVGSSTFGKVITGNVTLKISPDVIDIMSKAARNEEIIAWIVCRDQKNGLIQTPEQLQYAKNAARFYSLSPTPEQAIIWQKENPFPSGSTIKVIGKVIDKTGAPLPGINVTIKYQGKIISSGATNSDGAFIVYIPINYQDAELEINYALTGFSRGSKIFIAIAPMTDLKYFKLGIE